MHLNHLKAFCAVIVLSLSSNLFAEQSYSISGKDVQSNAQPVDIYNVKSAFPGIISAGQPSPSQVGELSRAGYKTVINLRGEQEIKNLGWDEKKLVEESGMSYISIPVAGAKGVSKEKAQRLHEVLSDSSTSYPVLVHCASGNRVGAMFALDSFHRAKLSQDAAIEIGRTAGLTKLEPLVRKLLK